MPSSASTAPLVRAETRNTLAASPCCTTALAPLKVQPPSARRTARVATLREFVMRARLVVRERRDRAAFDQLRDERFLRVAARERHRPAHHQRAEKRLDDEPASEAFEHDGDIETLAAEAAVGFTEQRADDAQFGEAAPHLAAETVGRARDAGRASSKPYCSLTKRFSVSASMRRSSVCWKFMAMRPYSPRIILEMMFFWISFEPPKIDSLRLLK